MSLTGRDSEKEVGEMKIEFDIEGDLGYEKEEVCEKEKVNMDAVVETWLNTECMGGEAKLAKSRNQRRKHGAKNMRIAKKHAGEVYRGSLRGKLQELTDENREGGKQDIPSKKG